MRHVSTDKAPAAIGPYVQATRCGPFLFVSGQLALRPDQPAELQGTTAAEQVAVCLENIRAIVEEAGGSIASIARTTIFMTDLDEFEALNAAYSNFFGDHKPARATVGVASLPKGASVEVEAIAYIEEPAP